MKFVNTQLKCPQCGTITSINRKASSQRKAGHLKNLWCYKCREEVNHVELRDASEFDINEELDLTPINKKQDKIKIVRRPRLDEGVNV